MTTKAPTTQPGSHPTGPGYPSPHTAPGMHLGPPPPVHRPGQPTPIHPMPNPPLNSAQQNAFDLMSSTLRSWGLSALINDLRGFIVHGDTNPDTLSLKLSQTDAYKQRFKGNEIRRANGLAELKPAEYIALEEQYQNVLRSYGLPGGFYDSHDDFTDFIGKDISAAELDARAKIAHDQYLAAPEYVRNLWTQYYGTTGDAIAAILDPNKATALIQDRGQQVAIGGAAAAQGFQVNQARAQQFQQAGVTLDQARKAYQQIAQSAPLDQAIASRFGTTFGQTQEENDLLLGQGQAGQQRQQLYDEEQGLFKNKIAFDTNSLGVEQEH